MLNVLVFGIWYLVLELCFCVFFCLIFVVLVDFDGVLKFVFDFFFVKF